MGRKPRRVRRLAVLALLVAGMAVWRSRMISANERAMGTLAPK